MSPAVRALLRAMLVALCLALAACRGTLVHEVQSPYSHIQVYDSGGRRAVYFGGEQGGGVVETLMDLREPHVLQHGYVRAAMAAFLYRPRAESCLLIGLGGGSMVRFMNRHFPELRVDVVELDPAMVAVARDFFGTADGPRTRIFVADGREYLERPGERYDMILIDAHLHPGQRTDATGHPLTLQGEEFYRSIRRRLHARGIVMFNILTGPDAQRYVEGIRRGFPATEVYHPRMTGNLIVFASPEAALAGEAQLRERAREFDRSGTYGFSFERVLDDRERGPR